LEKLDLAVLSACDSGRGDVAGGEGVFGLQRAFHVAGAKNVIASLWKVDDRATAALMNVFYHQLWVAGKPAIQALRRAQLTIYRHPERVATLAGTRGPDFETTVKLVDTASPSPPTTTAPARLWAAFVLSGAGQ
jgi:CHAT domain-containing protein